MTDVALGLSRVRTQLAEAVARAGRAADSVQLIAVSKFQSTAAIRAAYATGQRDFGENYVQELQQKATELADLVELRWHMIGHLQRNKARVVAPIAALLHTVHSVELVHELDKRAHGLAVLIEVNVGGETQKSGCSPETLPQVLSAASAAKNLVLRGLMCVPPHTEDPGGARPYFDELVRIRDLHGGAQRLPELSMGMTADLEYAVAAGATMVRVGTAIFGARPKAGG
ncbi:MAG: YggS family pyridoxal phosphate-dependent enzyme [Pseudomonadota bacterium]